MDMLIKLTIPSYIYHFYHCASQHVAQSSAEDIMSDALCAYAGLINNDIAKQLKEAFGETEQEE